MMEDQTEVRKSKASETVRSKSNYTTETYPKAEGIKEIISETE